MINAKNLLKEIDHKRLSGELQKAIADNQVTYQGSLTHPGCLEKVSPDGTKEIGLFQNGHFNPIDDSNA